MTRYNPSDIEPKWQQIWADDRRYEATEDASRQKYYVTGMFPYPSGAGMHTGHFFEHSIVDAVARFRRTLGDNVVYPMGWDSFGLPAENYAIKTGRAPQDTTRENIANFTHQLRRVGASIDWSREINTADPEYYKWTQWIFTKFYERGLAYQKESLQWWCPVDKTVLANEQVEGGHCWRCGTEVVKKSMKQWFFKITEYADALLDGLDELNWPEKIKTAQRNWIGKSVGAEIEFSIVGRDETLTVFSTRPDTIFGATFLVLAPEHPLARTLAVDDYAEFAATYINEAVKKSEIERSNDTKEKTGVFTGSYAINPATGEKVPIWVADYVLGGYGTGAVMAVPAHDERDYAFAEKFALPIVQVVATHVMGTGRDTPREEFETLHRPVVDAIITDGNGKYLIQIENEHHVHFVGGGIDETDDSTEAALRREIIEEVGLTNIISIKQASPFSAGTYARETKNRNQKIWGTFFEVVVDPSVQVDSEIDEGLHTVEWIDKADVEKRLTWAGHKEAWSAYLKGKTVDIEVREGVLVNSGVFDGMATSDAREEIVAWLEQQGTGRAKTTYKMRDWLISRQRYWGAPIPIAYDKDGVAHVIPEDQLPVMLPTVEKYEPDGSGKGVLAREESFRTVMIDGEEMTRETDTMDGYACSSWYLLRYTDPHNAEQAWSSEKAAYWSPVDMYVGGDHAVAHLLYVRFWNHVFYDMGLVPEKEPVKQLVYHGLIQAEDGRKMSKSLGNVVDPLEVIDQGYGADALRTYELFLGPINENSNWSSRGIAGVYRFLSRAWTLTQEYLDEFAASPTESSETASRRASAGAPASGEARVADVSKDSSPSGSTAALQTLTHRTIKKVTDDYRRLSFNTAIAALMEYVNELYKLKNDGFSPAWQESLETLVQLLQPVAPHISAELWQQLGHDDQLDVVAWPSWDESLLVADTIALAVQVNGKVRAEITVAKDASEEMIKAEALAQENVQKFLQNKEPTKVIYVRGRLVSIVM